MANDFERLLKKGAPPPPRPRRKGRRGLGGPLWAWLLLILAALAVAAALYLVLIEPHKALEEMPAPLPTDTEQAVFGLCPGEEGGGCVIDGDTFWYGGVKYRIADINTPETSEPECQAEADLGARATLRLLELLNAGSFSLEPIDRETDVYGRTLRNVSRGGQSLGQRLVLEGLAEEWRGFRGNWCD